MPESPEGRWAEAMAVLRFVLEKVPKLCRTLPTEVCSMPMFRSAKTNTKKYSPRFPNGKKCVHPTDLCACGQHDFGRVANANHTLFNGLNNQLMVFQ